MRIHLYGVQGSGSISPRRRERDAQQEVAELRRLAARSLGDPALLTPLLAVIRGEYEHAAEVPEAVQALIRDGLAVVETRPAYRVRPADARDPSG